MNAGLILLILLLATFPLIAGLACISEKDSHPYIFLLSVLLVKLAVSICKADRSNWIFSLIAYMFACVALYISLEPIHSVWREWLVASFAAAPGVLIAVSNQERLHAFARFLRDFAIEHKLQERLILFFKASIRVARRTMSFTKWMLASVYAGIESSILQMLGWLFARAKMLGWPKLAGVAFLAALPLGLWTHCSSHQPGDLKYIGIASKNISIRLRWIPDGELEMGCSEKDMECDEDEYPAHLVKVSGFWMSQYEITQTEWMAVMPTQPWKNMDQCPHFGIPITDPHLPVSCVSWDEATLFTQKLGQGLRLPTEEEWEHAARGGLTQSRHGELQAIAWFSENSGVRLHRAGAKSPNAFGLQDMLGNAWEWTMDPYIGYTEKLNPSGRPTTSQRVYRGGSAISSAKSLRASHRNKAAQNYKDGFLGFRLAQTGS